MSKKLNIGARVRGNVAVVKIIGDISQWDNSAADFIAEVDKIISSGINDLNVYINSGGGSVFEANEIVNVLSKFTGTKTAEIGTLCASAATYIVSGFDKVKMAANGQFMIHKPMMTADGNEDELEADLKLLKNLTADYLKAYSKRTGLSENVIANMWRNDYWMNAQEAKDKGFVDEIISEAEANDDVFVNIQAFGYKLPQITSQNNNQINKIKMSKEIKASLSLQDDAIDAAVVAAIEKLKKRATESEAVVNTIQTVEANALVDKAIKLGLMPDALKEVSLNAFKSNHAEQKVVFEKMISVKEAETAIGTVHAAVKEVIMGAGKNGMPSTTSKKEDTFDWLQKNDIAKLRKIQNEQPALYAQIVADYNKGVRA